MSPSPLINTTHSIRNLQHHPPHNIPPLHLLIHPRQLPKPSHLNHRPNHSIPNQIHRLHTLLQRSHQIPNDPESLDDDSTNRRVQRDSTKRDPNAAERPSDPEHATGLSVCFPVPDCNDCSVCAEAVDEFADSRRGIGG